MTRRTALYLRISLDRTGEGLAVDRQREDGERLIELRGWQLDEALIFTDNDISAAGGKRRPGFDAMLAAIRDGRVDVVVAWSLDRLTRNRRDQLRLIETCQRHSVNLALVRGSDVDLSSAAGRAIADILSATARMEIEQKSERQARANRQAAEQGRMVGGRRAFGYTDGGMHLDPDEAPLLAQMYQRFLTGAPLGSLARWLNEQQVPTARGKQWRTETVRVVLANPRNAGLRAMRPVDPVTGRRGFYHADPIAAGCWPAVVSEQTWRQTLRILQNPGRLTSTGNRPRYLLSGIALCGWDGCGEHVYTSHHHGIRTLRCRTRRHVNRRADYIEAFVVEALMARLRRPDARDLFPGPAGSTVDLDAVRAEAIELRAELRAIGDDLGAGRVSRELAYAADAQIRARLSDLDEQIAAAGRVDVVAPLRAADDPEEVWDGGYPLETQREVLRRVMRVTVLPGRPGQDGGLRFHPDSVAIDWHE